MVGEVVFPTEWTADQPCTSSLLSSVSLPRGPVQPYFEQLRQLHVGLSMLPDVLAPASRPSSPRAEARVEALRLRIIADTNASRAGRQGDYPRPLCTRFNGPFLHGFGPHDDSGAEKYKDREWSPLPADDEEARAWESAKADKAQESQTKGGYSLRRTASRASYAESKRSPVRSTPRTATQHLEHELAFEAPALGIVTPPTSTGSEEPVARSAPRLASLAIPQPEPDFADLLNEAFEPVATSTQHEDRASVLASFSQPGRSVQSSQTSRRESLRAYASQPSAATPSKGIASLSPTRSKISPPTRAATHAQMFTPNASRSPSKHVLDDTPSTPARKKAKMGEGPDLPITPVSVHRASSARRQRDDSERGGSPTPARRRRGDNAAPVAKEDETVIVDDKTLKIPHEMPAYDKTRKRSMPQETAVVATPPQQDTTPPQRARRAPSPTPTARQLATLPHFSELANASARKRKLARTRDRHQIASSPTPANADSSPVRREASTSAAAAGSLNKPACASSAPTFSPSKAAADRPSRKSSALVHPIASTAQLPRKVKESMSFESFPVPSQPSQPTPSPPQASHPAGSSNSLGMGISSSPAGYGQQGLALGDLAPSQFVDATGLGFSQGDDLDMDMPSSSQSLGRGVEERVRGVGRFMARDAEWKY